MSTSQEIRMRVGQNIRRRREEMNLSQEELAHAIGKKSRSAISKIEKGTNDVGQSDLLAIAAALDTTAADLLDGPKIVSALTQKHPAHCSAAGSRRYRRRYPDRSLRGRCE